MCLELKRFITEWNQMMPRMIYCKVEVRLGAVEEGEGGVPGRTPCQLPYSTLLAAWMKVTIHTPEVSDSQMWHSPIRRNISESFSHRP